MEEFLDLHGQSIERGYAKGLQRSEEVGLREGRALGVVKGKEVGFELGYYATFARCWLDGERGGKKSRAAAKKIVALVGAMEGVPPSTEDFLERVAAIKELWNVFCSVEKIPRDQRVVLNAPLLSF